jgi:type III restriction enzyme
MPTLNWIGKKAVENHHRQVPFHLLKDYNTGWNQVQLVSWLERNIPDEHIMPDEKSAFLNKAVSWLVSDRKFSLERLVYSKFRLRSALEEKIKDAKLQAMKKVFQTLLFDNSNFLSTAGVSVVFQEGRYAYDRPYAGFTDLPKHFFRVIGNLNAEGEEFECAVFLATQLDGVRYWVRNIERKPTSFSLQTATDRFYPDFICKLNDGRILVVEYKNSRDWDLPDNIEKRQLGELWEKRSNGTCLFIMPKGKDFEAIKKYIQK